MKYISVKISKWLSRWWLDTMMWLVVAFMIYSVVVSGSRL